MRAQNGTSMPRVKGLLTICGDVAIALDSDVNVLEPSTPICAKDEIAV